MQALDKTKFAILEQMCSNRTPAYAARLLGPHERIRHIARPRWVALRMLMFFGGTILALAVFSVVIQDIGFIRLASLPAFPLLGSLLAKLTLSPVIFVTDRRVVFAHRFHKPLIVDLECLKIIRLEQSSLTRLLGFSELHLLFKPPDGNPEGFLLSITLPRLPDAIPLGSAIIAAAKDLGNDVMMQEPPLRNRRTRTTG